MALLLNLEHLHILPETCLRHAAAVSRGADGKAALNCDRGVVLACDFASDRARRNPAFRGAPYAIIPASSHYAMHLPEINPAETAASKLVSVLDPGKPIWDSIVTKKFGLELKLPDGPAKLDEAVLAYGRFEVAYAELLSSKSGRAALAYFDRTFPEYAAKISAVKKLDCLLWSAGAETDDDEVW